MESTSRSPESDGATPSHAAFEGAPSGRAVIDDDGDVVRRSVLLLADFDTVWEMIVDPALRSEWDAGVFDEPLEGEHPNAIEFPGDDGSTVVSFTVDDENGGVRLTIAQVDFRHSFPENESRLSALDRATSYWNDALDRLAGVLEKQDSQ